MGTARHRRLTSRFCCFSLVLDSGESNPVETRVALSSLGDASDILRHLLTGGRTVKAGQIAGAFRRIGRPELADEILAAMKRADYDVRESDPFAPEQKFGELPRAVSPIVGRIKAMWETMRDIVIENFPQTPGLPKDTKEYLGL